MEKAWNDKEIPTAAEDAYSKYWEKLATMIYNNINIKMNNSESSGGGTLLPMNSFQQKSFLNLLLNLEFEKRYYKTLKNMGKELKEDALDDEDNKGLAKFSDYVKEASQKRSKKNKTIVEVSNLISDDIHQGKPGDFIHLGNLSQALKCPIQVYSPEGKLYEELGSEFPSKSLKIKYNPGAARGAIWKNPRDNTTGSVYDILGDQMQRSPDELQQLAIKAAKENSAYLVKMASVLKQMEDGTSRSKK